MDKYEIARKIETFAPLGTQEAWDCSGWAVNVDGHDEIRKVMLCLTVTDNVVRQAKEQNCDLIISHHPLFSVNCHSELVSESYAPQINVYCAHTNLDKAKGGTTDTLVDVTLNLIQGLYNNRNEKILKQVQNDEFLRIVELYTPIQIKDFSDIMKQISPNARMVNNNKITGIKKIAFCSGSGSEFITDAQLLGADCLVTGDLKFHTALESNIVVYDIGHFESEILVLPVFEKLIGKNVEIVYAKESCPFIYL